MDETKIHLQSIQPINTMSKLLETGQECFCKTPKNLQKYFPKQYSLALTTFQRSTPEITTAVKVKIIKYRLHVDALNESVVIQCYVHFLNSLRNIDTWVDYDYITSDVSKISFSSKDHKNLHNKPHRTSNKQQQAIKTASQNLLASFGLGGSYSHSGHNISTVVYQNDPNSGVPNRISNSEKLEREYQKLTNVKFISNIYYDSFMLSPQYWSPIFKYSDSDVAKSDNIYICHNSLNVFENLKNYESLRSKSLKIPKNSKKIYECETATHRPASASGSATAPTLNKKLKVYEMNPSKSKELQSYCQRLALFSKLFIDHKTLFFDNEESFIFYVLFVNDKFVGYFSKETGEEETLNYNHLSCFVVLPQYQKKGYGLFLASLADVIAQKLNEKKIKKLKEGSGKSDSDATEKIQLLKELTSGPEFPLSPSGRKTYFKYWKRKIKDVLSQAKEEYLRTKPNLPNLVKLNGPWCVTNGYSGHGQTIGKKRPHSCLSNVSVISSDKNTNTTSMVLTIPDLSKLSKIRQKDLQFYFQNSNDFPVGVELTEHLKQPRFQTFFSFENFEEPAGGEKSLPTVLRKEADATSVVSDSTVSSVRGGLVARKDLLLF